jgi:hypothetical protein
VTNAIGHFDTDDKRFVMLRCSNHLCFGDGTNHFGGFGARLVGAHLPKFGVINVGWIV